MYFPDGVIVEAPSFHLDLDSNGTGALASNVGDFYLLARTKSGVGKLLVRADKLFLHPVRL